MNTLTINKIVPTKRFSSFNSNWMIKLYGDVYSFYSTNSLSRDKLNYESGEVFNIHYGDIHTKFSTLFDLTKELVPLINIEVDLSKYSEEKYCQEGDLVIADASEDYADIGKTIELINLNNERVLAGLHTFLARPNKDEIARGFAGYLMQSWKVRKQVMVIAQGSKVLGLASSRLGKVKLCMPEFKEQQKIASFISAVDEKLQQLTKKKGLLEEYKKGVMQKIFSQELRFKDNNGNSYPNWEEKKLGDLCDITTGKSNREDSGLDGEYTFFDRSEDIRTSSIYLFDAEAVIVAGEGSSFPPKYFRGKFDLHQRTYAIMGFGNLFGRYLFYYLHQYKNYFVRYAVGSTVKSLRLPIFKKMNIHLPSFEEQKKIANFLTSLDSKTELVSIQIENTKAFKKGLLQQMFV